MEVNFIFMLVFVKIKKIFIKFNFIDSVFFYKGKEWYFSEINFIGMFVFIKIKSSI